MSEDLGVVAAALTPRGKRGDLDFGAAFELMDFLCAGRARAIVFFTAAGEYPAFGTEERIRLLHLAAKRSRLPLFAGVGAVSLDDSLSLAREAISAGVAGVLLPPPHFYRYRQEEIREFYLQFAAQAAKSAAIYISNTPSVTTPIDPATALDLLATGQFAGIEDPGADGECFTRQSFAWLAGDDSTAARARTSGACGVISAAANAAPELIAALDCAVRTGNSGEAARLDAMLQEFQRWTARFPQPVILKVAAELRGIKVGPLPVPVSTERQLVLDEFREWFHGWLPAVKQLSPHA
jgi:dihydrodipicolinate synthase/N-acetylneuraminate lyase